ncbi:MAG TPA: HAD family phosphatase [Pyrinomonadaceae bacterium]|nr:HAD family phosphatase [Pyrinomonadaceae bacterium]
MIKAILLDFNGIVIDDEPLQLKAAQAALKAEGITLTEEDYYDSLGMDDVTFFRAAAARAGRELADEDFNRVLAEWTKLHRELLADELPLFPGVVTFIKSLARRYPLAVVSMARRASIEYVLERAGLAQAFAVVVSAEDVSACKPDPACVNRALEKLNEASRGAGQPALAPAECLVIEDAPPGIEAARAAGMRTLGVTNTVGEAALRAAGADVVTHSLADWTDDAVRHVFNRDEG